MNNLTITVKQAVTTVD